MKCPRESIRARLPGGASTVKVERSGASNTFTAHSEPYNRDEIHARPVGQACVEPSSDDLRTRKGRPAFRVGARDRNGREHSEDGADDHISDKPARSLCGRKRAGTVSERRRPWRMRRDARIWRRSEQILPTKDFASVWLTCSLRGNQSFHDGRGSCMVPILKPFVEVEAKF